MLRFGKGFAAPAAILHRAFSRDFTNLALEKALVVPVSEVQRGACIEVARAVGACSA
jgi:hypothetical protein